jgi:uncharacterized protein YndB with AHSA1/START domain
MNQEKKLEFLGGGTTRRQVIFGAATSLGGIVMMSSIAKARAEEEISHTSESIHQEPIFKANRQHVYEALTDAKQFDKVVQLGAAMKSGMVSANKPSEISREVGGGFSLFGGLIVGRQVELVPNTRIVQAWRAAGEWKPGVYSIAKFELIEEGGGTRIVFDHRGFPDGEWQHLAEGWKINYWEPLGKYLNTKDQSE